jgi:hypothetical protein
VGGDRILRQFRVDADVILAPDGAPRIAHVDLRGLGSCGYGNEKNGQGDGPGGFHNTS